MSSPPSTTSQPPAQPQPGKLSNAFASMPFESHGSQWQALYDDGFHPWDRDGPSLALADLLRQRADLVPPAQSRDHRGNLLRTASGAVARRTALVPGCGLGNDVALLASFGYDVWGLDVSPKALELARKNVEDRVAAGSLAGLVGQEDVERGEVHWVAGDFFGHKWTEEAGRDQFDLVYDYTFLCALPLEARPRWAHRMSELVAPDGRLICLEFPVGKPLSLAGPPWGLLPEVYEALLAAPGEEISYNSDGTVVGRASPRPVRGALHRLCLVKPLRTHDAGTGEDGTVKDFISVWSP